MRARSIGAAECRVRRAGSALLRAFTAQVCHGFVRSRRASQRARNGGAVILHTLVRLVAVLAGAACIALLSLVAAPGSAGSRLPSRPSGVDPALLQPLLVRGAGAPFVNERAPALVGDPADLSLPAATARRGRSFESGLARDTWSVVVRRDTRGLTPDPGASTSRWTGLAWDQAGMSTLQETTTPGIRSPEPVPAPIAHEAILLHGIASWYDNGTTAMRWPRGARIRICGPASCVTRIVTDWGPDFRLHPDRVVDLMPVDFVRVCGCSLRVGLTRVSVEILA